MSLGGGIYFLVYIGRRPCNRLFDDLVFDAYQIKRAFIIWVAFAF